MSQFSGIDKTERLITGDDLLGSPSPIRPPVKCSNDFLASSQDNASEEADFIENCVRSLPEHEAAGEQESQAVISDDSANQSDDWGPLDTFLDGCGCTQGENRATGDDEQADYAAQAEQPVSTVNEGSMAAHEDQAAGSADCPAEQEQEISGDDFQGNAGSSLSESSVDCSGTNEQVLPQGEGEQPSKGERKNHRAKSKSKDKSNHRSFTGRNAAKNMHADRRNKYVSTGSGKPSRKIARTSLWATLPTVKPVHSSDTDKVSIFCHRTDAVEDKRDPFDFPLEAQIPEIQRIIREPAESMSIPYSTTATAFLALCAGCIGRAFALRVKQDWLVPGNLWYCLVAPAGMRKSPIQKIFFKELFSINTNALEEWVKQNRAYKSDKRIYEKAKAKATGNETDLQMPEKPKRIQFICDDITPYALVVAMQDNPRGICHISDEFSSLMHKLSVDPDLRGKYLSGYSCEPFNLTRKNEDIVVPVACLSIFGCIQPNVLIDCASKFKDDGFIDRFLFVFIEDNRLQSWTDKSTSTEVTEHIAKLTRCLVNFSMKNTSDGQGDPNTIEMSEEANALFKEWFEALCLEAWLSRRDGRLEKFKEQAIKIILNLHVAEAVLLGKIPFEDVSVETTSRALEIVNWLKNHQIKAMDLLRPAVKQEYSSLRMHVLCAIAELAEEICRDCGKLANKKLKAMMEAKGHPFLNDHEMTRVLKDELKLKPATNCHEDEGKQRGRGYEVPEKIIAMAKEANKRAHMSGDMA